MNPLLYPIITLCVFIIMEGITWCTHKYVMHGFLWYLHKDHHQPRYNAVFEKNDAFFVIFAIPSIALFYFGTFPALNHLFFIGLGIALYGLAYFTVHDIIIHQRMKLFGKTRSKYLQALRKGHMMHHKHMDKNPGESYGMLWVPMKYFKDKFKA